MPLAAQQLRERARPLCVHPLRPCVLLTPLPTCMQLKVTGMTCAACSSSVEGALRCAGRMVPRPFPAR